MRCVALFRSRFMQPVSISLDEMLAARDLRQATQNELLSRFRLPLVCATLSIAGPVKDGFAERLLLSDAVERLKALCPSPVYERLDCFPTGPIAYLCFREDAATLKRLCVSVEETLPAFRLVDLDVLSPDSEKIERTVPRRCLLCDRPAHECARSRAHGLLAVQEKTRELLTEYASARLGELAVSALLEELSVTPKAGLVDRNNNGSHRDMDFSLFTKSANTLLPYFSAFVSAGADRAKLTEIGLKAEQAMFAATNGINTHRGAIYCFGLTLGALGETLWKGRFSDELLLLTQNETESAGTRHGQQTYARYGVGGAKTEARLGFPHAREAADRLKTERAQDVFLYLLTCVDDSTLLYRGGEEAKRTLKAQAAEILRLPLPLRDAAHLKLDETCRENGWTAGGAADLLALGLFLRTVADATRLTD